MPSVDYRLVAVGLSEMMKQFEDLGKPLGAANFRTVGRFEKDFAAAFEAVQASVHVITGYLRDSGIPRTFNDGDSWSGEIEFAGNPGVFELARGDEPTANHPEGGHGMFDAVTSFLPKFEADVDSVFEDAFKMGPV